jgi:hypothetical protein
MVLSLGMEGGLSADKSWGDFHMITDILAAEPSSLVKHPDRVLSRTIDESGQR